VHDGTVLLTKTDYLNWLTCPGFAWVIRHRPEQAPPEDDTARRKLLAGSLIESLARTRFPGAVVIDTDDPDAAVLATEEALTGGARVIFHATLRSGNGLLAEADALIHTDDGWHLLGIKSSAADPLKPNGLVRKHLPELAFAVQALEAAGIPIARGSLLHVDRRYRRNGAVDVDALLTQTDVTAALAASREDAARDIARALTDLRDPGTPAACECLRTTRANRCGLFHHFHPHIPDYDTIYHISGIHRSTLLPAVDRGIVRLVDWPDDLPLAPKQRRQVDLARSGREIVATDKLAAFLGRLRYPLHFLDYETFQHPVPIWEGHAPQQQVPFQYSLHIVEEDGAVHHREHLCATRGENPVPGLVARLAEDMRPHGSVIVWNKAFEASRNAEMAALMPDREPFLSGVNRRMVDLADVVSKGWWLHPAFGGRWSLKSVLPVAAPDLRYDDLEISEGGSASERWTQCMIDDPSPLSDSEREATLAALRDYCRLDTLAMVRIWRHLRAMPGIGAATRADGVLSP
jgi:hypothetical protein